MSGLGAGFSFGGSGGGGGISATDPTTPVATATVPGVRIDQDADVASIVFSMRPATYGTQEGTDPVIGGWNFAIGEPADFSGSGTRKDRILGFGYNISKYGGGTPVPQQQTGDASFGWTIEDFYNLNATTLRQFEYYIQSCPAGDDGTGQVRPFMVVTQYPTLASNSAPTSGVFFDVDESQGLTITITHAGGTDTWLWHESTAGGLDTECLVSAGSGFVLANNSRSLKQKISSGTPKDIAYINSSNNLILGEGGIVEITAGIMLRGSDGIATKYITAHEPPVDGDFISTPPDGSVVMTYVSSTMKLWGRANGTWAQI